MTKRRLSTHHHVRHALKRQGRRLPRWMVSFRAQTVLIVAVAVASVALALVAVQAESIRNHVQSERADAIERAVAGLQDSADHYAIAGGRDYQRAELLRVLPDVARLIGATEIRIYDSRGQTFASVGIGAGAPFPPETIAAALESRAAEAIAETATSQIQLQPFELAGGEHGVLATRIDIQPLLDSIAESTRNSLIPSLLVLLFAIPLAAFVSNRILARTYEREQRLRVEARFGSLVRNSSDLVLIVEPRGSVSYVSPSVERILGYRAGALEGHPLAEVVHPDDAAGAETLLAAPARAERHAMRVEWQLRHHDGDWRDFELMCTNLSSDPTVRGLVFNGRDISERKALEEQLTHQAFHDPLTGLANRALFSDRINQALARGVRNGHDLAVVFLDLDDFKTVNDSLGHGAGDRLLVAISGRLLSVARGTDTVARLGGDEFAMLLEDTGDAHEVTAIAERVVAALRPPFEVHGRRIFVSASTGIALTSAGLGSTADLLRAADMAMYGAKGRGKGLVQLFDRSMQRDMRNRLNLSAELRRAIERRELVVHYQPVVRLSDRRIVGHEALVRWQHPRRGLLLPDSFIPFADDEGLIHQVGAFVLETACRDARGWQLAYPTNRDRFVSVNLSAREIGDQGIAPLVSSALTGSGLPAESLVLEITENAMLQETAGTAARLDELKALGVRVAIDDFGTGYSSLSYLRRLPVDMLKIDRSFVENLAGRRDAVAVTRAIVELARSLRLQTIAEGVEQPDQEAELIELGCSWAQGYLYGPAVDALAVEARLAPRRNGRHAGNGKSAANGKGDTTLEATETVAQNPQLARP